MSGHSRPAASESAPASGPAVSEVPQGPAASPVNVELGRRSLNFLAGRASDPDPDVRSAVAAAWGEIGNPKVLPLLRKASEDKDEFVRIEAGVSMFKLGYESGRDVLLDIVLSSAAPKGKLTPAQEMKALAHTKARAQALVKLSDMGNELVVAAMEQTLLDRAGMVRDATAVALCRLNLSEAPPVTAVVQQFLAAAKHRDDAVRAAAVKALAETRLPLAREPLIAAAADKAPAVRAEALAGLAELEDDSLADLFLERLKDDSPRARYLAAGALSRVSGLPAAAKTLRELAADEKSPALALRAMAGLAGRGESVNLDLAERSLKATDIDGRMLALEAIAAVSSEESTNLLAKAMDEDPAARVRVAAAAMLVKRLQRGPK